ncbi:MULTISPECIES: carbohydrate ABC transporter permease [Paenibacillus]|uniref:ABC transporter permease n=1 Tax=Paenibacillus campinasensis TaxID=66347 RepID=A0A268EJX0_9BACL|nr:MULTISPECIES: sugar ABC transporter permease [Paenibacillus]MUG67373.1 ABC transporter permease subunit [Paenibacillus campinasensis]PAD73415.1 ABC transporter permease [Paenibacillus campinasensis]PAK51205.1 ABC transporter permease [Paenibacillus sp. 7541]
MKHRERNLFITACTLPALILFAVFALYPFGKAFVMAFYDWSGLSEHARYIGLNNFKTLWQDDIVWKALVNNLFLLLVVPVLTMGASMLFAALLTQRKIKGKKLYRTVFFFPNVLSIVVISVLWSFVYHPTFGILNSFLELIGLESWTRAWLGDSSTVLWAIAFPMIWQSIGYYMIIYIAAIEGVPTDMYEAASIDGASAFRQFRSLTFPLIWNVVRVTIVFFLIGVFNGSFAFIKVMTNAGPNHGSEVLMTYMYSQAFNNGNFGYAMAIGVFMLLITVGLALISEKLTERDSVEY